MCNYLITVSEVIDDFADFLEAHDIDKNNISFHDVNDYLMYMYFDIFDNIEEEEDREAVEEEIENIIYNNFNINVEEN